MSNPKTLGDYLRNGRLARRLDRKSVANLLGTWAWTYSLWEKNRAEPKIWNMRKVVQFLGFCPIDPDDTPGRRLVRARQCLGLGQKRLAEHGKNADAAYRVCNVCGNTVAGEPPETCPICGAKRAAFTKVD